MEYGFLKGFLLVLLIQNGTSEGVSTSIQSSTVVTLQDGQTLPEEPELHPAEVVPVVAPPSLKEVQQAVQEATERVEGRGAEEVLKGLLERVVGAALRQVEGGSEVKVDEGAVQKTAEKDALRVEGEKAEAVTEAEVLDQAVGKEVAEDEDMGIKERGTGVGEGEIGVDALEDGGEEGKVAAEEEGETAAGSVVESKGGVETGGREADGVEVIDESLDIQVSQEVALGTVTALEETGGDSVVEEQGMGDNNEQVVMTEEKDAAVKEAQEAEEIAAVVEVAVGREEDREKLEESDHNAAVPDVEQITDEWGKEIAREDETQVDELESEVTVLPLDNYETEAMQTVAGETVEEGVNEVKHAEGLGAEEEQVHLAVEGGAGEHVETEVKNGESDVKEESVALVIEEGDQQAGEEEPFASEPSLGSDREDQGVLVISATEPEDGAEPSIQPSPEKQIPALSPGGVETGGNTLGDEISNHGNEIITPADDLLPHNPVVAEPTLDNVLKDALAEPPQGEGEEPGEANGLVEDTAVTTETRELGLEAWKIGAISAAVFLVLETVVIMIYIMKCRNKNSTPALQRACEEGCVEPEATTGGDSSDDTLPAGHGDTQEIAALDPSDVASTLAQNKERHEEAHVVTMSDLSPASTEDLADAGPDSSQDLRTSVL